MTGRIKKSLGVGVEPPQEPTPMEEFCAAVDAINIAWERMSQTNKNIRPWINWDTHEIVLIEYKGLPIQIYPE